MMMMMTCVCVCVIRFLCERVFEVGSGSVWTIEEWFRIGLNDLGEFYNCLFFRKANFRALKLLQFTENRRLELINQKFLVQRDTMERQFQQEMKVELTVWGRTDVNCFPAFFSLFHCYENEFSTSKFCLVSVFSRGNQHLSRFSRCGNWILCNCVFPYCHFSQRFLHFA